MNEEEKAFLIQAGYKFEFNPARDAGSVTEGWLVIAGGISNVSPEGNEEIDQTAYYDGGGFASSDVIGKQDVYSFEGHRLYGDAAQDYIFDNLAHKVGPARNGTFRVTDPKGNTLVGNSTVANISGAGGAANSKGEVSFEIHYNGLPTFTPAAGGAGL